MSKDDCLDYGRCTDNPSVEMKQLQKEAEDKYGKISDEQLGLERRKAIAKTKADRAQGNHYQCKLDVADLLERPIGESIEEMRPSEDDRLFYLYVWQRKLEAAKERFNYPITEVEYKDKKRKLIVERLGEIEMLLNGEPVNTLGDSGVNHLDEAEQPAEKRMSDINRWLYEKWIEKGRPGGSKFFQCLKSYKDKKDSPIEEYVSSGRFPCVRWKTERASGSFSRKAIQNKVSEFKNAEREKVVKH